VDAIRVFFGKGNERRVGSANKRSRVVDKFPEIEEGIRSCNRYDYLSFINSEGR
jgi:hypothetical protein